VSIINFVHVPKTGGTTIHHCLLNSEWIKQNFNETIITHCREPDYSKDHKFLFALRNPIERLFSVFNYRKIDTWYPDADKAILQKYGSLSNLAEELYDGDLNEEKAKELSNIIFVDLNYRYHFKNIFDHITREKIHGVICYDTIEEDIRKYIRFENVPLMQETPKELKQDALSVLARNNLKKYLKPEFDVIQKLLQIYPLTDSQTKSILV